MGHQPRGHGGAAQPFSVVRPFAKALKIGEGYIPLDALIGRTAERFGQTPESIEAGDCYNLRVEELLRMADDAGFDKMYGK